MTAQPLPEKVPFGNRYWLTDLLAVGGMAEIYLARQNAMAGFEKDVVIKRLKPELGRDRRIVEMFLDEARIGAVLNHPNIVHVYDVDEHEGLPYIAMEYIRGEELNQLCRRGLGLDKFLPLEHSVELVRQAASGMGYFHARRDAGGEGLDIVHCDISPTNLLVTEDGFLKVIDFGIARARNQRFRDGSAIPGKLSYMAPEQAKRETTDHRSDIFSLGVVLYEITVGRRLFKGPASDVVKRLIDCAVEPPTFVRRDFPGALESVIMRALEKHPADRYQSAYDLADDLEDFLRDSGKRSGPMRIARYLDELTTAAGGERRPELISEAELTREDDALDFDRGMFEDYRAATSADGVEASDWDEFEESEREVAAALGIDPELLDPVTRTPVPADVPPIAAPDGDDSDGDDGDPPAAADEPAGDPPAGDDDDPGAGASAGGQATAAPARSKSRTRKKSRSKKARARTRSKKPAADSAGAGDEAVAESPAERRSDDAEPASPPPELPPAEDGPAVPWIPIGAGIAAGVAGLLYLLLT